uniref:Uncharacterized protein n=1 Tax=Avena sativa TaxID=4498 RepID=A0ACD5WF75_AVESA
MTGAARGSHGGSMEALDNKLGEPRRTGGITLRIVQNSSRNLFSCEPSSLRCFSPSMDPPSCKRQKQEFGNDNSPATQSPSSIISQNRSVRLNFLAQFSDLKHGSVTEDYKAINNKRHELINTLKLLQLVPIKLPYASSALKSSDARLHDPAQSENNISSDNIIDLDPHNVGDHVHGNMENIGAEETTCVVDSDDEDMSGQYQDTIMLDDDNCSSEVQLVVKQGMDDMGVDNEPNEISLFDGHSTSDPPQQLINQGHDDTHIYIERHDEEKEVREREAEDIQNKGHIDNNNTSVVDPYRLSCEVIVSDSTENGHYDNSDNPDGLEDLFREMDVALVCLKTNGSEHSIVPSGKDTCEVVDCYHEFLVKDDLGMVCRLCGLIQQRIENMLEFQWKKPKQSYRTYPTEPRNSRDLEETTNPSGNILQVAPDALSIHPQHSEQMKPHQVEGFNFLIKNLADENNPGGCILAHAPEVHMFKITGKSTPEQRNKTVERFNNSQHAKIFFGSIKACGEGISLVGASRVVILDVHENPSVMRQALGRAFRPGQSRMVYCYRLVAADSPEEEDHNTAFRKEWVSKMWFESNEFSGNDDFELADVDVADSGDSFFECPALRQDIRYLYKR